MIGDQPRPAAGNEMPLAGLIHALLFAAPEPLTIQRLSAVTGAGADAVRAAVAEVRRYYQRPDAPGGVFLQEVAGGLQLVTVGSAADAVAAIGRGRPQPLSPAALETLAILAYEQPSTRAEIEAVRGVKVDGVISTLLERGLIREVGRKQVPGRPILYATAEEFLRFFGLRSLEDLPEPAVDSDETGSSDELPVSD